MFVRCAVIAARRALAEPRARRIQASIGLGSPILLARRTNNRKVAGSMPANVVCTVYHS